MCMRGGRDWEESGRGPESTLSTPTVVLSGRVYSDLTGWWLWLIFCPSWLGSSKVSEDEQGFPSFTSTGTATRRGLLDGLEVSVIAFSLACLLCLYRWF